MVRAPFGLKGTLRVSASFVHGFLLFRSSIFSCNLCVLSWRASFLFMVFRGLMWPLLSLLFSIFVDVSCLVFVGGSVGAS